MILMIPPNNKMISTNKREEDKKFKKRVNQSKKKLKKSIKAKATIAIPILFFWSGRTPCSTALPQCSQNLALPVIGL
jgi:hypothetical protein